MEKRVLGPAAGALAFESAALFAYGQLTGVWGASLSQSHPTLNKHLNPHHCDYTVFLLMRASAKAQVTLVTKLKGGHPGANSQNVVLLGRNH